MTTAKRAALYVRVSTDKQTIENQVLRLKEAAAFNGWQIVATFEDAGISGSKGRDERPGLDAALKAAKRHSYDVLMAWSLDRLGRSTLDLAKTGEALTAAGRDLYLDKERIDTTSAAGEMFYTMLGAIAQFERRRMIERVHAGIARAKTQGTKSGKPFGRPAVATDDPRAKEALKLLAEGIGICRTAKMAGLGVGTVSKLKELSSIPA
ncbi:MAG TPA: recombinase family protein [Pseudolabrys sp.]